jgi:hypothetical protein
MEGIESMGIGGSREDWAIGVDAFGTATGCGVGTFKGNSGNVSGGAGIEELVSGEDVDRRWNGEATVIDAALERRVIGVRDLRLDDAANGRKYEGQ